MNTGLNKENDTNELNFKRVVEGKIPPVKACKGMVMRPVHQPRQTVQPGSQQISKSHSSRCKCINVSLWNSLDFSRLHGLGHHP